MTGRAFLAALAGYFALQVALRLVLGGALEGDEAEMVLLGREWHLAYGSQPPLYNWAQALVSGVFGPTTLAIVGLRNLLLFATYAAMFAGLRRVAPVALAIPGTMSLLLLPNLAWWAQRTGSHTIALAALTAATLAVFLHLADRPSRARYLALGLAIGLGGLAKPNYWVVPPALLLAGLTLPGWRGAVADRRLLLTGLVALAVVAAPYAAMLARPAASLSDLGDFHAAATGPRWLDGLWSGVTESAAALALLVLAVAGILVGRRTWRLPRPTPAEALLLRAAAIGAGLVAVAIVAADVSQVRSRWLLPLYMLAAPALVMLALRGAAGRARRNFAVAVAALAGLVLVGIADIRLRGAGSDSLRIDRLAADIAEHAAPVPPLLGPHYYTGNLLRLHPGWTALPPYPTARLRAPPDRLLVIGPPDSVAPALAEHGYPAPGAVRILLRRRVQVPFRFTEGATRAVSYSVVAPGQPGTPVRTRRPAAP